VELLDRAIARAGQSFLSCRHDAVLEPDVEGDLELGALQLASGL
jgi:hypothetical protein